MSSAVTAKQDGTQINRTAIWIILGLSLALVVGVLFGARYTFNQVATQPVAMPELPSPDADSPECAAFIDALPATLAGHKRAELAEPAPAGAAAWQSSSTERVTLRCGVELPLQYTELTEAFQVTELGGARWLEVGDTASTMATWFTVDRSPVVAVTADTAQLDEPPVAHLDAASLPAAEHTPLPAPLSTLAAADDSAGGAAGAGSAGACAGLEAAAPAEIAEGYVNVHIDAPDTLAWIKPGFEPVVLRCGVAPPERYAPGVGLVQVNEVPWFQDVDAGNGITADTFYALGRATDIAASIPLTGGNEIITNLSNLIAEAVPASN